MLMGPGEREHRETASCDLVCVGSAACIVFQLDPPRSTLFLPGKILWTGPKRRGGVRSPVLRIRIIANASKEPSQKIAKSKKRVNV